MRPVCSASTSLCASSSSPSRPDHLVLRVLHLQTVRGELELAVEDHALMRVEDVGEERLVEEHGAQRTGAVADQHLENLEAGPARGPDAGTDDLGEHRRHHARTQRGDGPERAAVLVADGESVQQVFDGGEPDALQIGGTPWSNTFQVLKRRRERVHRSGRAHDRRAPEARLIARLSRSPCRREFPGCAPEAGRGRPC